MEHREDQERELVIRNIRLLCDSRGREINPEHLAKYFLQLANLCRDPSRRSFICRSTLLNAVLNRNPTEKVRSCVRNDIVSLGKELLTKCEAANKDFDVIEASSRIYRDLQELRLIIKNEAWKLLQIPYDTFGVNLFALENERIETMKTLMQKISSYYHQTMSKVSSACIDALGEPPCKFSHFAMGSLAREEITLYSDFESGIILEDGCVAKFAPDNEGKRGEREKILKYFRWYAALFHVILINFGETPIHLVGIEGLNDQYSEKESDNWFFDCHTHSGITFDSFLPYASKTPFGRRPTKEKPFATELILPMTEMLNFLGEEESLKEGYHLSDMLVESRHVAGDENLFNCFKEKSIHKLYCLRKCPDYVGTEVTNAVQDLKKFDLTPDFATLGWRQNAKKQYYRPMSVYIPWLMRLCGVLGSRNSFLAIEKLSTENPSLMTSRVKHNLSYALAIANQLRLEVYSDRSQQSDAMVGAVHLLNKTDNVMNIFDAVGDRSVLDYCEIALGLRSAIFDIADMIHRSMEETGTIDSKEVVRLLEKHVSQRGNLKLHGDIFRHFQNYSKAIECYEKELRRCRDETSHGCCKEQESEVLMTLGLTCLYALQFERSIEFYQQAIDVEEVLVRGNVSKYNIAMACTMMGQCYTETPSIRHNYESCMEDGIRLWEELIASNPENHKYLKGLAEARDTEAFYFLRTHQHQESLEKYFAAAKLFEDVYGEGVVNNDTMKVQNGIAMCLLGLERYDEAAQLSDKVIRSKQLVMGNEVADVSISWYLRYKGNALKNLKRFDEAIETYQLSISMRSAAPGSDYDKFAAVAHTTCNLADCYFECGRFGEVLETADKVLALVSHISDTDRGKQLAKCAEHLMKEATKCLTHSEGQTTDKN